MKRFSDCICKIVQDYGIKVFDDYKLFSALISDIAYDFREETNFLLNVTDTEYLSFFKNIETAEQCRKAKALGTQYLTSKRKVNNEWAEYITKEIITGICLSMHIDMDSNTQKVASEGSAKVKHAGKTPDEEKREKNEADDKKKKEKKKHPLFWNIFFILILVVLPLLGIYSTVYDENVYDENVYDENVYDEYDSLEDIWNSAYKSVIEDIVNKNYPGLSDNITITGNKIHCDFTTGEWIHDNDNSKVSREEFSEYIQAVALDLRNTTGKSITIKVSFYSENDTFIENRSFLG